MLSDPILSSMIILELSGTGTLSKVTVQQILDCSDFTCISPEDKRSKFANMFNNVMNFITNCKMKADYGRKGMEDVMNHTCDILEYDKTHNDFYADLAELQIRRSGPEQQTNADVDRINILIKACDMYVRVNLKEEKFLQLDFANIRLKEIIKSVDFSNPATVEALREQTAIVQQLQNETQNLDQRYQIRVY